MLLHVKNDMDRTEIINSDNMDMSLLAVLV